MSATDASTTLEALPDSLLGRIMALAGRQQGPALTLVSKRWHAAFFSEPSLWRTSVVATPPSLSSPSPVPYLERLGTQRELHERWFAAKHALLRRVGGHAQRFSVSTHWRGGSMMQSAWRSGDAAAAPLQLPHFLALLSPGTLAEVSLSFEGELVGCVAALQALAAFPRLKSLSLCVYLSDARPTPPSPDRLPPGATQALAQLTQVQGLAMHDCRLSCQTLAALTGLTALELNGKVSTDLRGLTSLGQLWRLAVSHYDDDAEGAHAVQLPTPATFRRLGSYLRHLWGVEVPLLQVAGAHMEGYSWMEEPAPTPLWGPFSHHRHGGAGMAAQPSEPAARPGPTLKLQNVKELPALQPVVDALLPAGAELAALEIMGKCWDADWRCCQLASVTRLELAFTYGSEAAGQHWAALQALLRQTPRLQDLRVDDWAARIGTGMEALLDQLASGLQHLRMLELDCRCSGLPGGAYLAGLRELRITDRQLQRLPQALAAATGLTRLHLRCGELAVADADVDEILLRMPGLRFLELICTENPDDLVARLRAACPELHVQGVLVPRLIES